MKFIVPTSVRLDANLYTQLKLWAREQKVGSLGKAIRLLLIEGLKKKKG